VPDMGPRIGVPGRGGGGPAGPSCSSQLRAAETAGLPALARAWVERRCEEQGSR